MALKIANDHWAVYGQLRVNNGIELAGNIREAVKHSHIGFVCVASSDALIHQNKVMQPNTTRRCGDLAAYSA